MFVKSIRLNLVPNANIRDQDLDDVESLVDPSNPLLATNRCETPAATWFVLV